MAGAALKNYDRIDYASAIASIRALLGGAIADWAKKYITKDHEREDFRDQLLAEYVRLDLDAMSGLIIGDVRTDKEKGPKLNPYVTVKGMVVLADRFGRYGGMVPTSFEYRGDDPLPFRCTAGVYRKDFDQPVICTRRFNEAAQKFRSGDLMGQWNDRPETMLEKATLGAAFQMAFPSEMNNMAPQALGIATPMDVERRRATLVAVPTVALPPATAQENQSAMVRRAAAENAARAADVAAAAEPPADETPREPMATPEHVSRVYRTIGVAPKHADHNDLIAKVATAIGIAIPAKWSDFTAAQLDEFIREYEQRKTAFEEPREVQAPEAAAPQTQAARPPKGERLSKLQKSNIETRVLDLELSDAKFAELTLAASSMRTAQYGELSAEEATKLIYALKELLSAPIA